MSDILFDLVCVVGVFVFVALLWQVIAECRFSDDEDEHEEGGIG